MYNQIEQEIIKWSLDGTKTAGYLTRKIIKIIKDKQSKSKINNNKLKKTT
jgi:hypothetical protein